MTDERRPATEERRQRPGHPGFGGLTAGAEFLMAITRPPVGKRLPPPMTGNDPPCEKRPAVS